MLYVHVYDIIYYIENNFVLCAATDSRGVGTAAKERERGARETRQTKTGERGDASHTRHSPKPLPLPHPLHR